MKKANVLLIVLCLFIFSACLNQDIENGNNRNKNRSELFRQVYNPENTPGQEFVISASKDTLLVCQDGMRLKIYAHSFADSAGNTIEGVIQVEIKTIFSKADIVMNNLMTISNEHILLSDGMIYLSAKSDGKALYLSKPIKAIIQRTSIDPSMNIYEGVVSDSGMNWIKPEPVENETFKQLVQSSIHYYTEQVGTYTDSVKFHANYTDWLFHPKRKVGDDTLIDHVHMTLTKVKYNRTKISESPDGILMQEIFPDKGVNDFMEDLNTNYIFSIKKLGWANIDKLYDHPKTEQVDLIVKADNEGEFDYVFISMIFKNQQIYLPGYQRKDHTYGFTHSDNEKAKFPLDEEVVILATAYKNNKPFFDMQQVTIKKHQIVHLMLKETSLESLKKQLETRL